MVSFSLKSSQAVSKVSWKTPKARGQFGYYVAHFLHFIGEETRAQGNCDFSEVSWPILKPGLLSVREADGGWMVNEGTFWRVRFHCCK